jgi:hypothetical protein
VNRIARRAIMCLMLIAARASDPPRSGFTLPNL